MDISTIVVICFFLVLIVLAILYSDKWASFNSDFEKIFAEIDALKKTVEENRRTHREMLLNAMIKHQSSAGAPCLENISKVLKNDEQCGNLVESQCDETKKLIVAMYVKHPTVVEYNKR